MQYAFLDILQDKSVTQVRLPCCPHHHRCLHNLLISSSWNPVAIKLSTTSSPCPEQLPFCSVAVSLTILGTSCNHFPFISSLFHRVSLSHETAVYIRVASTPTFDRACTFCPSPTSGYKCWDYRQCARIRETVFLIKSEQYSAVCLHHICLCLTWFFFCFWPFFLWFWDLNPGLHTS